MKNSYDEKNGAFDDDDCPDIDSHHLITSSKVVFHVGQCYEEVPAVALECKICGCVELNVATGDYVTCVRCPTCKWEKVIHEG